VIPQDPIKQSPSTAIAGPPTIGQLRRFLDETERNPERRVRLFEPLSGPRAAVINGLTDAVLNLVVAEWESLQRARILDYGCGTMPYAQAFVPANARLIGADVGPNKHAQVRISDDGSLPMADGSFDWVLSLQVLEHVSVPDDYLREARRVLKEGGKLFLATHGLWPYHPTPHDYHRWKRDGLTHQLRRAGFDVCSVHSILSEYSAALQFFVMNAEYSGGWKRGKAAVHLATNIAIRALNKRGSRVPQLPAVLCVVATRRSQQ
jgi:SAM-dependent methyltransferase